MNQFEPWGDIIRNNELFMKNFDTTKEYSLNNNQEREFTKKIIQFNIQDSTEIITHVTQNFYEDNLNDVPITQKNYNTFFDYFSENIKNFEIYQKLYITYVSENEIDIFDLEIGDPIIIIEKKITDHGQLIFSEEELSKYDKYYFQEVSNEL